MSNKKTPLSGKDNQRLNNKDIRNNEITFPLADENETIEAGNLTIPSEEDVIHAKEWVDKGSRL